MSENNNVATAAKRDTASIAARIGRNRSIFFLLFVAIEYIESHEYGSGRECGFSDGSA
jgi:hypothetical protein